MSMSDDQRNAAECPSATENIKVESDAAVGNVRQGRRSSSISDRTHNNGSCDNGGELFEDMPEVFNCLAEEGFSGTGLGNKTNKLQQIIEDTISSDSKQTVSGILDQVNSLSTAEKLLLYLRLPSSKSQPLDPLRQPLNPLGSRFEIQQTITWIRTHLEEDQEVSLPKHDIYEEYLAYCGNNAVKPLSTADFGKVMKQVFPSVRPRRLGMRGKSRYCYAGMRKRTCLQSPLLPDLAGDCTKPNGAASSDDEVLSAASSLVREWAEKLLSVRFASLQDLACHLVENLCVDSRSVDAFTLLSALEPSNHQAVAGGISPLLLPGGKPANKRRETQLQLQRLLQEKEVIREQKRKLKAQQQSSGRSSSASDKPRAKRPKLSRQNSLEDVKPAVNQTPTDSQETARFVQFASNRPPSNCDKKQAAKPAATPPTAKNRYAAGNEEFVDYSTISVENKPSGGVDGVPGNENRSAETWKILNGSKNNNVECGGSTSFPSGGAANRRAGKTRHASLDFGTPTMGAWQDAATPDPQPRSSLRFYLEHPAAKKPSESAASPDSVDDPEFNIDRRLMRLYQTHTSPPATSNPVRQSPIMSPTTPATGSSPQTVGKVLIPRLAKPRRETPPANLIIFPQAPPATHSPKHKYKPIQPKVDTATTKSNDDGEDDESPTAFGKEGSAFFASNTKKSPSKLKPPGKQSRQTKQSAKKSRTPKASSASRKTSKTSGNEGAAPPTSVAPRARNEVSIGSLEKDAFDDYLHGGSNSQEQEEELMQYFPHDDISPGGKAPPPSAAPQDPGDETARPPTAEKFEISQLRLLLEKNNVTSKAGPRELSSPHSASQSLSMLSHRRHMSRQQQAGLALPSLHPHNNNNNNNNGNNAAQHDVSFHSGVLATRQVRRVSFETTAAASADHSVPPSPNTRRRTYDFTPISPGPHSPLGRTPSKPSSANASPFVSPRNTPVPRSRNNSTQAKLSQSSFLASMQGGAPSGANRCVTLGISPATDFVGGRSLASFAGQSLNSLMAVGGGGGGGGVKAGKRSSLQRSSSVNAEAVTRYALESNVSVDVGPLPLKYGQAQTDTNNEFTKACDDYRRNNAFANGCAAPGSASAPQSPIVQYHPHANAAPSFHPIDFKALYSNVVKPVVARQKFPRQQATTGDDIANVTRAAPSMDDDLQGLFCDELSPEATLLSMLQYRSQSVPPYRSADTALVSPHDGTFAYSSAANSMAPTPVPSEYQDFGPDSVLDPEGGNAGVANSDNMNQIFNLWETQGDAQIGMDQEGRIDGNAQCASGLPLNDLMALNELLMNDVLEGKESYNDSLSVTALNVEAELKGEGDRQQQTYQNDFKCLAMSDGVLQTIVDAEMAPPGADEIGPLPYKSTFEYVTDGTYRTFSLNALNENGCGARRNISVLLEPTYFTDEVSGVLPHIGDGDQVGQLERQVDKL